MLISYANRNTQVPKLGVSGKVTAWSFIRERTRAASQGESAGMQSREACQQRHSSQDTVFPPPALSGKSAAAAWRPWVTRIPHNQVLLNLLQAAGTFCLCPSGNLQDFTAENLLSSTFCLAGEKTRTPHVTSNICLSGSTVQVLKVNLRTATVKTDISQGDGQQLSHRASP